MFTNTGYINEISKRLKAFLDEKTYTHCINTAIEAERLAELFSADKEKAAIAGLLHDCAKTANVLELAAKYNLKLDPMIMSSRQLAHAYVGAEIAHIEFGISDEEILIAIRSHTLGNDNMTVLDKIIFVADFTEPGRNFEGVELLRRQAKTDINEAMITAIIGTIRFVLDGRLPLHMQSLSTYNSLISERDKMND
ncbi:MAG TPA: bis(5'-nucleosyl)-tetraphosphatase (symmetrical) YqeK [Clostridia bacterium]|nr:bis(5'-nucleosyl)-tetraphosphatase (symmetrical) YqeK [Clostridia bacterium]